jgi:wyosine [tRNA(Phe)-imidazoG37] synthetase (radical SAM superfamily)
MTCSGLGLFIGAGKCNANCKHCAGLIHRSSSPKKDGIIDYDLIKNTIIKCHQQGARSLSISCSGEPTLSPISISITLELIKNLADNGYKYDKIHLYSNGIRIGNDIEFVKEYLPAWKILGLDSIYLTVHSSNEKENAKIYGVKEYPSLLEIVKRIHSFNLKVRANLVLGIGVIETFEQFKSTVDDLIRYNVDGISSWQLRDVNDEMDIINSISKKEFDEICDWVVQTRNVTLYQEKEHSEMYSKNQKLTLFPDGKLSNKWCK